MFKVQANKAASQYCFFIDVLLTGALWNRCSENFCKVHRKTPTMESCI